MVIFAPTKQLSHTLQSKDTTVQEAREAALVTEKFLRRQRTNSAFKDFYKTIVAASQNLTNEPVLPRHASFLGELMMEKLHISHPHQ